MKTAFCLLTVLFANAASETLPCERVSEIIGDAITFVQYDFYLNDMTRGLVKTDLEYALNSILQTLGIDATNSSQRDDIICRAFAVQSLHEIYEFLVPETPLAGYGLPYERLCDVYQYTIAEYETGNLPQLELPFVETLYNILEDFVEWMKSSGFPSHVPIGGVHEENLKALQALDSKLDEMFDLDDDFKQKTMILQGILTPLIPIGPLRDRDFNRYNRTSPEQVLDWLERSSSIFTYAEKIRANTYSRLNADKLGIFDDILRFEQIHYQKVLWYKEILTNLMKTDLLKLDVSDCPVLP